MTDLGNSITDAHQTFYDETGVEISLDIDRALKKILLQERKKTIKQIVSVLEETKDLNDIDSVIYAIKNQYK